MGFFVGPFRAAEPKIWEDRKRERKSDRNDNYDADAACSLNVYFETQQQPHV